MAKIADFHCTYDNASGFGTWVKEENGISFPEAYLEHEAMAALALAVKKHNRAAVCQLPFCHTLEAEALGGIIRLGDGLMGPRTGGYCCKTPEDVLNLPPLNVKSEHAGRLRETLTACAKLKEKGETVLFLISGPITILNGLLDGETLFRGLLKETELMGRVFERLGNDILTVMKAAEEAGADLLSYADPSGGVGIVGPKIVGRMTKEFTVPFLKRIDRELTPGTVVFLCPKTSFALIGTETAAWYDRQLPEPMEYLPAVLYKKNKIRFVGQDCINRVGHRLENGILKEVILNGGVRQ